MNELVTIKKINGFDVTFLLLEVGNSKWITAYARFDNPIEDVEYASETYRDGEVIGVDTAHFYNLKMTLEEKQIDAEEQMKCLIEDYRDKAGA